MKAPSLVVGTNVRFEGQAYVVDHCGPRGIALRAADPNAVRTLTVSEFTDACKRNELEIQDMFAEQASDDAAAAAPVPKGLSEYTEPARKAAALTKSYLLALCPTGTVRVRSSQLDVALQKVFEGLPAHERGPAPLGSSSFYAWRRKWINSGYIDASLIPRIDKRGRRPAEIPSPLRVVLNQVVEEFFGTSARPTIAETHRSAIEKVRRLNRVTPPGDHLPIPTYKQVRRIIESHDAFRLLERRHGKATADARTRIYQAGPGAERPLERVEVDHTRLDVICIRIGTHDVYVRPWLTVLIDVATRMIVGVWISYHTPNAATVLRVLKQAIRPKAEILARYKLKGEWPAKGVPSLLVMDNGKEFHSKALEAAAEDIGMSLVYCPSREPRFKGVVERFMRTINTGLIHMLPGTTFSNPADRDEYKAEEHAVLTIDELRHLVFKWVVEVYSTTFHRGTQSAPLQRWKELAAAHPPQIPGNLEVLDVYLRPLEVCSLGTRGIEINTLFYTSPELEQLRRRNGLTRKNLKLPVRPDPDDLGAIRVLHPDTNEYFTARCTQPEYASGMSLEQHKFHKTNAKAKYKQLEYMSGLLASKEEIRDIVKGVLEQDRRGVQSTEAGTKKPAGAKRPKVPRQSRAGIAHAEDMVSVEAAARAADDQAIETVSAAAGDDDRFMSFDDIEAFGEQEPEMF